MNNRKILIITHSKDNGCIEQVSSFLGEKGADVIRFDVDRYPLHTSMVSRYINGQWNTWLISDGQTYSLDKLDAIWYRRAYGIGSDLEALLDKRFLQATQGELRHTLIGMVEGQKCFILTPPSWYRRMDSKELQLKAAIQSGLQIPPTCITNDPDTVRSFASEIGFPLVVKMQSSFAICGPQGDEVVYTSLLTEGHLDELDSLKYCPMMVQKQLTKAHELRVTVVGEAIFAFRVDSQSEEEGRVDWRKAGKQLLHQWQPTELPAELQTSILTLMGHLGLWYGAIDLIYTPSGEYCFLEVNAAGEYFWLDRLCGHRISQSIADLLFDPPQFNGKVRKALVEKNGAHV